MPWNGPWNGTSCSLFMGHVVPFLWYCVFWFEMMLQGQHCKCAGLFFFTRVYEKKKDLIGFVRLKSFSFCWGVAPAQKGMMSSLSMLVLTHFGLVGVALLSCLFSFLSYAILFL